MRKESAKLKILVGIPAAGKSTWANEYVRNNPGWVVMNRDSYRKMLKDQWVCEPKIEDMITEMFAQNILSAIRFGQNVIVDNTNLKSRYIMPIIEAVEEVADVEYQIFDISIDKAIERDNGRDKKVGEAVIKKMYKDYLNLLDSFNFTKISRKPKIYKSDPGWIKELPHAAIFDIDGTLAHMNGKRGPFDHERVDRDDIDPHVSRMVKLHKAYGDKIIIVSGREDISKDLTVEWLKFYEIDFDVIHMRKTKDFRKDSIVKKEIYNEHIIGKYNIVAIYDDRKQVVDTLREEMGLKVFQVEPGNF